MNMRDKLLEKLPPVIPFLCHVFSKFQLARWALVLSLVVLLLEYISVSVMIPISIGSASDSNVSDRSAFVGNLWVTVANSFGLQPTLILWIWLFLILLTLRSAAGYAHVLLTTYLSKQVHRHFSEEVFHSVLFNEPIIKVYKRSIGHYVSLAGDDTFRAGSIVNSALQVITAAFSAFSGLFLLYLFSPPALTITLCFLAVLAVLVKFGIQLVLLLNRNSIATSREAGTTFLEALNSLRSIRSMACEPFVYEMHSVQMKNYTRLLFQVDATKASVKAFPGILALIIGICVLGPWFSASIPMAPGLVVAGTMLIIRLFVSLGALMTAAGSFLIDARAAEDLRELIRVDETSKEMDSHLISSVTVPVVFNNFYSVELNGISFFYKKNHPILSDLTIRFVRGKIYAIIGPSGVGKSTIADILLGILEPEKGQIFVNGGLVGSAELRGLTVLVEQNPRMFSASIKDNLTLGLAVTDAEIEDVLDAVDLTGMVNNMPDGVNTRLEYQGSNLSGGQRQRLSIARALLRKPKILILDEATSALDADTRDIVVRSMRSRLDQSAVLFITHDKEIADIADETFLLSPSELSEAKLLEISNGNPEKPVE